MIQMFRRRPGRPAVSKGNDSTSVHLRLAPDEYDHLFRLATKRDQSIPELIRQAIRRVYCSPHAPIEEKLIHEWIAATKEAIEENNSGDKREADARGMAFHNKKWWKAVHREGEARTAYFRYLTPERDQRWYQKVPER